MGKPVTVRKPIPIPILELALTGHWLYTGLRSQPVLFGVNL